MLLRKFRSLFFLLIISNAAIADLWDDAPNYDGWRYVDWFGYLYPAGDYTLHAEHGWQYPCGTSQDNLYLFDYATSSWVWTSKLTYPWLYWYGEEEDWVFYYRGATPGNRWFYARERRGFLTEDQLAPAVFESGPFNSYPVTNSGSTPTTIVDDTTGLTFSVAGGQSGELRVAQLSVAPTAPYPGNGYTIESDDLNSVELVIDSSQLDQGEIPMVFVYGKMQGAFDDETGYAQRWSAIAYEEDEDGSFRFFLPESDLPIARVSSFSLDVSTKATSEPEPPRRYWISQVKAGSTDTEQRININLQIASFASNLSQALDATTRSTFETRRDRKHVVLSYGENAYSGFNNMRAGSYGRKFLPHIRIKSATDNAQLPHETAHYLSHLLLGDNAYDAVESAGGYIFKTGHWIGKHIGRENLLEDYAYLIEDYLKRFTNELTWESNGHLRGQFSPLTTDIPGVEGFGATMLAVLHRSSTSIWDYSGKYVEIPPLDQDFSTLFRVMSRGALSVDTLRQYCEEALSGDDKTAFQVILGRLGWSYYIRGRLVDDNGQPVSGATVRNILKVGEEVFEGGSSKVASKADGSFVLTCNVFGGESLLEITLDSDSIFEVPIQLDWTKPTITPVQIGDVVVGEASDQDIYFNFDYGNEQAFPAGFTIGFSAQVAVKVLSGDADLVRIEKTESLDYNTPSVILRIFAPEGSEITVSGPIAVVPSSESGIGWALANKSFTPYPGDAFSSQSGSSGQLNYTVQVDGTGIRSQIYLINQAEFRAADNTYIGRFSASIQIMVMGE